MITKEMKEVVELTILKHCNFHGTMMLFPMRDKNGHIGNATISAKDFLSIIKYPDGNY